MNDEQIFTSFKINDALLINHGIFSDKLLYGLLKGYKQNSIGELILFCKTIDNKYFNAITVHPSRVIKNMTSGKAFKETTS